MALKGVNFNGQLLTLPVSLSELQNDTMFITATVDNLSNYYLKQETYTKDEVNAIVNNIHTFSALVVDELPTENISTTTIYIVAKTDTEENDYYDEYMYINNAWEMIGNTRIDLSNYYTKEEIDTEVNRLWDASNIAQTSIEANAERITANATEITELQNSKAEITDIPTSLGELSSDSTHRTVTDDEKTTWNNKATTEQVNKKVNKSGDTMTGLLNAHGGISLNSNTPEETGDMQYMLGIEPFVSGGKVKWKRADNIKVGSATNAATLNGETKTEILQTGFINAAAAGAGQSGYIGIVRLIVKSNYVNSPTEFKIIQRGTRSSVTVSITFANTNNTDPALARAIYSGNSNLNAFIRKESTSTWVLYVQKSENYDGIEVIDVAKGNTSNIQVDLIDTFLSSKPSDVKDLERISIANYDEDLNNIKSTYLKKAGDRGLELWGITEDNRAWNSANPKILFGNAENGQKVGFIYNDYDNQIAPAGISLRGEQGNEYFDAPRIFANVIKGDSTVAGFRPSSGNELNFSSNDEHFYIGYENRVPVLPTEVNNSKRVTDYHFGTHSGADGKDKGNVHAGKFIQNGNDIVDNTGSWQLVTKQEIESWDFAFNGLDFEDYDYRIEYDFVKVNSDSTEGIKAFLTENGTTLENKHTRWVQIRAGAPRTSSGTTGGNVQLNAYSVTELNSIWLMDGKTGSQNYFGHVELSKEYTSQDVINFSTYCCMPEYKYCNLTHGYGAVYDLPVVYTSFGDSIACNGIKFLTYCTVNGTIKLYRRKR